MKTLYRPELLYADGTFIRGAGILVGENGRILDPSDITGATIIDLPGKALLPGFVNVHSHSFQRLIRGQSESRVVSGKDFWSWRGTMYHAAAQLDPQDIYDVARMAFLEMLLAGTTTVGEFHYVHNSPTGLPYDDPNILARQVIAAAESVGIRIVLLRTAYLRAGFELRPDPGQSRFYESSTSFLDNMSTLIRDSSATYANLHFGVAPHSIRAVPLPQLKEIVQWSRAHNLPIHMHVAEQIGENIACDREYATTPVAMLSREGLLGPDFTAVHAVHITAHEVSLLAAAQVTVCSCPTTERNLGDGIVRADHLSNAGVPLALGSDSQAQIDPLEDARQLDYHLRLQYQERAILDQIAGQPLTKRLFDCATINGARSLALPAGQLTPGAFADFVTIDLSDTSIAGHSAEDLLPILVFSLNRSAIRDVAVNGRLILRDRQHVHQAGIIERYQELHRRVWSRRGPRV